ncbi:response regulator [Azospirillum sp.]|uniref:response regulator n=1 Tax=Azospirillum sp. TaxID=34012 RepID=UPI002D387DD8|nr:response regulator [Azospirillum sp.]HYD70820.1 response regulator [Azospirillum sp.]
MTALPNADGRPLNVLLAEDDAFMRSIIANLIRTSARCDVVVAGNGREAVDRLTAGDMPIGIALLDFVMPQGNGLEVAQRIRVGLDRVPRDLPIAMLTGRRDAGLVRAAMELDVNAYVVKPVTKEGLFSRLERARAIPIKLKDPDAYRAVDIPNPWGPERPKRAVAPAEVLPEPAPCAAAPRITRVEKRIDALLPGDLLARSVRGHSGEILLPGHIRLDRALIARLSDLAEMGMIPPVVFTVEKEAPGNGPGNE